MHSRGCLVLIVVCCDFFQFFASDVVSRGALFELLLMVIIEMRFVLHEKLLCKIIGRAYLLATSATFRPRHWVPPLVGCCPSWQYRMHRGRNPYVLPYDSAIAHSYVGSFFWIHSKNSLPWYENHLHASVPRPPLLRCLFHVVRVGGVGNPQIAFCRLLICLPLAHSAKRRHL